MTDETPKHVFDTDDEHLRHLTHEHLKVFAKFTSATCAICQTLAPPFAKLAEEPGNESVLFVRLDSHENPVAQKMMQEKVSPFFVSYYQGRVLECDNLTTEVAVRAQLERLRTFVPGHS